MHIPDEQLDLFAQRLSAIGVGRRDFLKVVGAMAAFGGLGFATQAQAATPTKPGPGEKLAKEQVFRYGGGGYFQNDPASHDFNKDLYCSGVPALFAGLMVFNSDFVAVPWMASKVEGNKDGSVWTFTIRKDSRWSDNSPGVGARFRVVVEAAARSRQRRALCLLPLRHQERRGLQQEEDHRPEGGRGPRQGRLDARGDARGTAGLLPRARRLPRRPAGPQAGGGEVRRQVDGGREPRQQRAVHAGGVGPQQADRAQEEPALLRRQGRAPEPRDHPDHPGGHRGLALREQRARPHAPAGRRPQAAAVRPPDAEGRLPLSVPRDLVPPASGDEAALRQPEGPPGGLPGRRPRECRQGERRAWPSPRGP